MHGWACNFIRVRILRMGGHNFIRVRILCMGGHNFIRVRIMCMGGHVTSLGLGYCAWVCM